MRSWRGGGPAVFLYMWDIQKFKGLVVIVG